MRRARLLCAKVVGVHEFEVVRSVAALVVITVATLVRLDGLLVALNGEAQRFHDGGRDEALHGLDAEEAAEPVDAAADLGIK